MAELQWKGWPSLQAGQGTQDQGLSLISSTMGGCEAEFGGVVAHQTQHRGLRSGKERWICVFAINWIYLLCDT